MEIKGHTRGSHTGILALVGRCDVKQVGTMSSKTLYE